MQLKILNIILFSLLLSSCKHQNLIDNKLTKNELYIIGTSHSETQFQNYDTLIKILNDIKPDVILIELDSSFFFNDFNFDTLNYPDLFEKSLEVKVSNDYKKNNEVNIRPFDIEKRNDFYKKNDFFNQQGKMYSDISNLFEKRELNQRNMKDYELIDFTLNTTENIKYITLKDLNSELSLKLTELRQKILYDKTIQIVKSENKLNKWIDFAKLQKDFWIQRNTKMFDNINRIIKKYDRKRILIFVGATHKYFLNNLFEKDNNGNYLVKDYYNSEK